MNKRCIIVHCWDCGPESKWYQWLKEQLEERDIEVMVPQLPETEAPKIEAWVPALAEAIGAPDDQTYLIGHSMGCQTIVRYLARLPEGSRVGGVVFVAGFFTRLSGMDDDLEATAIARPWLETPIDFAMVKKRAGKSVALFSDDDPWVPLDNQEVFRDELGSEIVVVPERRHFDDAKEPIVLEVLEKILAV